MIINYKGKSSNYTMDIIKEKFLVIIGEGTFSYDDAQSFIQDFKEITAKNDTLKMELIVNNLNLKLSPFDVRPLIEEMSGLYRDTVFAKKHIVMPQSVITRMQIHNNDVSGLFDNFNTIENIESIIA